MINSTFLQTKNNNMNNSTTSTLKKFFISVTLSIICVVGLLLNSAVAQTVLISPSGDGGFENGATFEANGWTVINSSPLGTATTQGANTWHVGNVAGVSAGSKGAYVSSTGGATWGYNTASPTTSSFYRDVTSTSLTENILSLTFQWKGNGETGYDRLLVYAVPNGSATPGPNNPLSNSTIMQGVTGATLIYTQTTFPQATYAQAAVNLPSSFVGTTFRIYFVFQGDNSFGTSPGAAVDEISLIASAPATYTSTSTGGLWSSAATWVGNAVPPAGNDFVIAAGSIVTIDGVYSPRDLTVNGQLQWNATANTLNVNGNMLINPGGKFYGYSTVPAVVTCNLFGNFTNNGYANLVYSAMYFNSITGSTFDGSGIFESSADGRGLVRAMGVYNGGNNTINTSQNLTLTSGYNALNGNLNTNGKIKFDNTASLTGLPFNQKVQNVAVTNMGSGYTVAPVVFGAAVIQYAPALATTVGGRYIYGNNVYLSTAVGVFNDTPPTSTGDALFTSSGPSLMWIGTNGNIGTNLPYNGTLSLTTQYFVGDNLYRATATTAVTTTFPTHTSGVVGNLRYVGQAPKVSVNFDAATGTVRSLNLVNAGSGLITGVPAIVFSVGVAGGTGSGAAATAVFLPRAIGATGFLVQKNGQGTVSGGLDINSDQGTSVATTHPQASTGVGNVSSVDGGNNYTVAPLVGFAGPPTLNLVTNPGSGYITLPTVIVTGGTLVSGTALATTNFTITMNQGKIVSVYLNAATTACYSVPPTIALSSGNATLAWPAGCWPSATAIIGSNGALANFNMNNSGFGYIAAPVVGIGATSGTAAGGTFSTIATTPTAIVGTYALTTNWFAGGSVQMPQADDAFIPASRKIFTLSLNGNGSGLLLSNNLTLYSTAPLTLAASLATPGNIIDLGGYNLNFTWNGYAGSAFPYYNSASGNAYIKNGSMTLTGRGGGTTGSTFSYPFDMPFQVFTGTGLVTSGSDILTTTVSQVSVANTNPGSNGLGLGTRSYKVENKTTLGFAGVSGTNPKVTMSYQNLDSLTTAQNQTVLVQSSSNAGPWTVVSAPFSATLTTNMPTVAGFYGSYGSLASSIVASPAPITLGATNYFAWGAPAPVITSVAPLVVCAFNDMITITGTGFSGVTAVSIGGTPVSGFTIVSSTSITCYPAAGTSGVIGVTKFGSITYGTDVITINSGPSSPVLSTTAVSTTFGSPITVAVTSPVVGTFYNWYTTPYAGFAAVTDTIYTAPACGNVYVSAGTGACESERTAVIVSVAYPQVVSSEEVFCGVGGGLSLQAAPLSSSASILWESLTAGVALSSTTANPTSTTIVNTSDFRLTVSALGCPDYTIVKSIGVYPLPSATVTTSASGVCPGTAATVNSGLSAGNFTVTPIAIGMQPVPSSAVTLVANGAAVVPQTSVSLDDGGWAALPIGFTFNYFGNNHTTINIGTNATVHLGTYSSAALTDFTFTTFPSLLEPASVIGAACHDMNFATSTVALNGSIKYWTQGYAPNRRFIVQYENARAYNTAGATAKYTTNQIHLLETLGIVEVHVLQSDAVSYTKVVGLQDQTRTIGAVALATSASITNLAWRFSPPSNFSTIWTANGEQIASGTNIFTQSVSPTTTTLYDISYTNQTTGCASEPNSAQVSMLVLNTDPIVGVNTTSTVSTVCAGSTVPLSHSYTVSSAGLTFQWQVSVDGGTTWTNVVGATATTFSPIQNVASSYRVGISSCLGAISYAAPVAIGMNPFLVCYCTPNTGSTYDEEITNVTLSTLNNSSTCSTVAPGLGSVAAVYGNYSDLPATNIYQNVPVTGSLTIGSCGTYNFTSGAAIFIDYNHNGSFSDAGERVWSNGSAADIACVPASIVPATFTPPISSLPGLTRMRIINSESTGGDAIQPCISPGYGEVEDYIVNIVGPPDAPATPIATNGGSCILGDTITMVGTAPAGVAYYWQTSASGTSFANSANTWVVNGNGTYYIRAYASMGGQWSTATAITLSGFPIVTPPTAITNLSGTPYCSEVTLQAGLSPTGISYYWQGTNPSGTVNTSPATSSFIASSSGTYYVAARNDSTSCWSLTTSINVVVYPAPTGSVLASSPASCSSLDGSVLFSVSGAGTVFSSDFSSTTLPAGATLAGNDAGITTNGLLRLTSAANSKNGAILINNLSGVSANDYQVDFDFITTSSGTTTPADGLSYSYGPDVVALPTGLGSTVEGTPVAPGTTNPENGSGSALKLAFDAYTNGANQEGVYLMYNTPIWNQTPTSTGVLNYSNNVAWRATASAGASTHVTIKVNPLGQLSMWLNGVVAVSNQQLPPSYLSSDKSAWKHALSARTGGLNEGHFIDNLTIQYNMFEYSLTGSTWSTSNPVSAAPGTYNASVRYAGVGGCVVSLGQVTIAPFSMNSVSISRADSLACSGELMTVNGTVVGQAAGLTYQWQISTDNGTTWGNISGETNINVSIPQTAASLYRLGVSYCGGEYAYTSSVSIAMDNVQNCFCIPAPTYGTTSGDLISSVSIVGTTLNNNTGFVNGTPAYMFYNSLPNHTATLMPSTTYTMNVATGAWGSQGMAAWIDYNDDGIFSTTERIGATPTQIGTGYTPGAVNATGSFTITLACAPPVGLHRLRVRTVYANNGVTLSPCTNYQWGETEDYMITIAPAPSCPSSGVFAANLITPPMSTAADFTWEQGCASSTSYDFEYGPVGFVLGTGTQVLNQTVSVTGTLASYTLTGLSSSSSYDVYSRVNCSTSVSGWSVASSVSTAPSAPTTAAQTFCQGATVANLVATAAGSSAGYCNYTFNTLDSFGDGWNGAQMTVMNGTTIVATLTLAGGSSAAQTVSLQSGISYSLVWNTAGSYPEEVGVSVVNSSGVTVYSMGYNSQALAGTTLATFTGNCTVTPNFYWYSSATSTAWLSSTEVLSSGTYYAAQVINGVQSTDLAATEITIIPNTSVTTPVSATYSYTWPNNGQTYTVSGVYSGTTTNCETQMLNLTILQPTVTFQVDMAQSNAPAGAIPYVNGTYNGWCGSCNPMTNIGGTVWALTVPLAPNSNYEYKFTYNGWDGQENLLAGSSCTVTNWGYTNRSLAVGTTDMVLPLVCWNSCSACGPQSAVTFKVDMTQYNLAPGLVPEVNGSFNGWCGNCNPMSDSNGDGVWETTVVIPNGSYEYKFSISNWAFQESLTPGSSCTVTNFGFTNRTLSLTAGSSSLPYASVVIPTVCWNSCSACSGNLTLNVILDGYYQYGSNPASMVAARYLNLVEAGSASPGAVTDVDLITVQLRSATNTETIVHTATPMLQKNGSALCVFPASAVGGSYYVVVDHKGSNPLWSANPVTLTSSATYNFANNLESAYSDGDLSISPMHTIVSGLYGIWLGELNEDGYLDATDYSNLEMDIYASGYQGLYLLDGDFNGDTYVDASDFAVFDSNSNYGAYEQRPY